MTANEATIYNVCRGYGFPDLLSKLIVAQSEHETANFTSAVFQDCKNGFGYSSNYVDNPCNNHSFYKAYDSLSQSADELCRWILRRQKEGKFPTDLNTIKTPEQYAQLLKDSGYYTDTVTNYMNGLKYYFSKILPYSGPALVLILLFLFILVNKNYNGQIKI